MRKITFVKAVASGNDFVVIDAFRQASFSSQLLKKLAKKLCRRKLSVGADGLLVVEPSKKGDFKMRIFNPDGTEVDMCGNGLRCAALYARKNKIVSKNKMTVETGAGNLQAELKKNDIKLKMSLPKDLRLKFGLDINGQAQRVSYINTGVPHVVCLVSGLDSFNVKDTGKAIRYHSEFQPEGTNADFIEVLRAGHIRMRTYERGVEDETLACGTGAVASAIITAFEIDREAKKRKYKIEVDTQSGETLTVYFNIDNNRINEVFLQGKAELIYKGGLDV